MGKKNLDTLLLQVISQARSLAIPISKHIVPTVVINTRARTRFGCCRFSKGRYVIEVTAALSEADESSIRQVLAHEILHTCPGCANHGMRWLHWASMMNSVFGYDIRRTHSAEALGIKDIRPVRYLVICSNCGKTIPRMKRSPLVEFPQRYRCKCGGTLFVTSLDKPNPSGI